MRTTSLILLLVNCLIGATLSEFNARTEPLLQKYRDVWADMHRGQKGDFNGVITFRVTLGDQGGVAKAEVVKEEDLPVEFKRQFMADVEALRFDHRPGETNVFESSMSFHYRNSWWDLKRIVIVAALSVAVLVLLSRV